MQNYELENKNRKLNFSRNRGPCTSNSRLQSRLAQNFSFDFKMRQSGPIFAAAAEKEENELKIEVDESEDVDVDVEEIEEIEDEDDRNRSESRIGESQSILCLK